MENNDCLNNCQVVQEVTNLPSLKDETTDFAERIQLSVDYPTFQLPKLFSFAPIFLMNIY